MSGELLAVDDFVLVKVDERVDNLCKVILDFYFGEAFAALDEFVESLIGADFEQDVDILVVLEDVLKLDHVLVVE